MSGVTVQSRDPGSLDDVHDLAGHGIHECDSELVRREVQDAHLPEPGLYIEAEPPRVPTRP